jgi:hypothetical protein
MTTTITARVSTTVDKDLREHFRSHGKGPSEGLRDLIEEFWAGLHFMDIEFKDSPTGRRAAIRGGPEIWEIVSMWRDVAPDLAALEEHFGWVDPDALEQALAFYEASPSNVDAQIAENDRYGRYLKQALA